jgi:hypothetical protein
MIGQSTQPISNVSLGEWGCGFFEAKLSACARELLFRAVEQSIKLSGFLGVRVPVASIVTPSGLSE